jgi:hypothetical protein
MKTLYESILDDEDVLIRKSKQDINNPFFHIAMLIANKMDYRPLEHELRKWLNKIEMPFDGYWEVTHDFIKFTLDDSNSKKELSRIDREILFISNKDTTYNVYKIAGDVKLAVLIIPDDNRFLSKILKSLKIKDYGKKMDELVKKYNLNYYSSEDQIVKVYII